MFFLAATLVGWIGGDFVYTATSNMPIHVSSKNNHFILGYTAYQMKYSNLM